MLKSRYWKIPEKGNRHSKKANLIIAATIILVIQAFKIGIRNIVKQGDSGTTSLSERTEI